MKSKIILPLLFFISIGSNADNYLHTPAIGDFILQQVNPLKFSKEDNEPVWDLSKLQTIENSYHVSYENSPYQEGFIVGTEHQTRYSYQQRNDTLQLWGYENSTSKVEYDMPEAIYKENLVIGNSMSGVFHGLEMYGGNISSLVQQHQSCESRIENHAYGIDFHHLNAKEGGKEEGDGDVETPRIIGRREVFAVHHQQGGSTNKPYDARAKTDEYALHHVGVHILVQHLADENHQYQGRKNQGYGCHGTAQYRHHPTHASVMYGGIAAIGGGVDADRSRCHLRDGDDIGKFSHRHPMILCHHLSLDKGYHRIATSESEDANLYEYDEKLKKYH